MIITPKLLIDVGCSSTRAAMYSLHIAEGCQAYEVNTPARLAMALAQIGHESGSFRYVTEIWGPTPVQRRYEGRKDLGNTQPGDGSKYRGHGLIQITGRANHRATTQRMRAKFGDAVPDFEQNPLELTALRWAALSAFCYWDWKKLNRFADAGDFEGCTLAINGGLNGFPDRKARWEKAKLALQLPV